MAAFDVDVVIKLVDQLSSGANAVTQSLQKIQEKTTAVQKSGTDFAKKIGDDIKGAAEGIEGAWDKALSTVNIKLSEFATGASGTWQSVKDGASAVATDIGDALSNVGGTISRSFDAIGTGLSGAWKAFVDKASSLAAAFDAKVQEFSSAATAKLDSLAASFAKWGAGLTAAITVPGALISQLGKDFDEAMAPLAEGRTPEQFEALKNAVKELGAEFPAAKAGLLSFFADPTKPLDEQIAAAKAAAEASKGADTIASKIAQIQARLMNIGITVATPMNEARDAVTGWLESMGVGALTKAEEFLKGIEGHTEALKAFGGAWTLLSAVGPGLVQAAGGIATISGVWKTIAPLLTSANMITAAPWILALGALALAFKAIYDNWDLLKPKWEEMKTTFADLGGELGTDFTELGTAFTDIAKSVGELAGNNMKDWSWGGFLDESLRDFAKDLAGLLKDINEKLQTLKTFLETWRTKGLGGAFNFLMGKEVAAETPKGVAKPGEKAFSTSGEYLGVVQPDGSVLYVPEDQVPAAPPATEESVKKQTEDLREGLGLPKGGVTSIPPGPGTLTPWGKMVPNWGQNVSPLGGPMFGTGRRAPLPPLTFPTPPVVSPPRVVRPPSALESAIAGKAAAEAEAGRPSLADMAPALRRGSPSVAGAVEAQGTNLINKLQGLIDHIIGADIPAKAAAAAPPTGGALPPGITIIGNGPDVTISQAPPNVSISTIVNVTTPDQAPITTANNVGMALKDKLDASLFDTR